jgi:hypothetical protein
MNSQQNKLHMAITVPEKDRKLEFGLGKLAFSLLPLSPESAGIYIYTYLYVCMYACMHVYIHIYIHIYI